MSKNDLLTSSELHEATMLDSMVGHRYDPERDGSFSVGDILLEEYTGVHHFGGSRYTKNSRGVPRKFKVVHVGSSGIPFVRELTARGMQGRLRMPYMLALFVRGGGNSASCLYRFVQDPGQLDAILLGQEYTARDDIKDANALFKEINAHNKKHSVPTVPTAKALEWLKTLKPGDRFWVSVSSYYIVQNVSLDHRQRLQIEVKDKDSVSKFFTAADLYRSRIYREQPRSYTQERKM